MSQSIKIRFQEVNITEWILTKEQAIQTVEMERKKMTNKLGLWSFNVIKVIKIIFSQNIINIHLINL